MLAYNQDWLLFGGGFYSSTCLCATYTKFLIYGWGMKPDLHSLFVVKLIGIVNWYCYYSYVCLIICSARFVCVKTLSNRTSIHGMVLLSLFVYKYVADTAFILISCRQLLYRNETTLVSQLNNLYYRWFNFCVQVFQYDTTQRCLEPPMAIFTALAFLTVLLFVIPIPILVLVTSKRQFSIWILKVNILSAGIVNWYKIMFIATQLVSRCSEYWCQERTLLVYCLGHF